MNRIPYRFVRDERLMKADLFDVLKYQEKRKEYANNLNKHPEIKNIEKQANARVNRRKNINTKKEHIRNNLIFLCVFGVCLAAGINVFNYFEHEQAITCDADWKAHNSIIIVIFVVIGAMAGLVLSDRPMTDWKTDNVDEFYKRLVVRYFDKIHAENPYITEEAIKTFNPDLSRTVYSLLAANLSKRDLAKLDDIALTIASALNYTDFPKNLSDIDAKMEEATKIVDKAVAKNPALREIVNYAYMGKIPITFFWACKHKQSQMQM